jgi:integrase
VTRGEVGHGKDYRQAESAGGRAGEETGLHPDGGNLYLQVGPSGSKSWLFRFMLKGRARGMGLGPLADISLAGARSLAGVCRRQLHEGIDPIEARNAQRAAAKLDAARSMTFRQCAEACIASYKAGWRSGKHGRQWAKTLETYAFPVFGDLPVQQVDVALVMKVLEPIWKTKTETASRIRGRIEAVLNWAKTRGYRSGENPAAWKGHLENLLPKRSKVRKVKHHPALPYGEIGPFMAGLRAQEGVAARALEFTILMAARSGEVRGARHVELDADALMWTIPGERMKSGREHRVPLSAPAQAIVIEMRKHTVDDLVFPGHKAKRPLNEGVMLEVLDRMGYGHLTVHGFRSTFRDWAAEQTAFPSEVVETALAHAVGDKVEAAYRRGDLLEKRRQLMEAWAAYCAAPAKAGEVLQMRRAGE